MKRRITVIKLQTPREKQQSTLGDTMKRKKKQRRRMRGSGSWVVLSILHSLSLSLSWDGVITVVCFIIIFTVALQCSDSLLMSIERSGNGLSRCLYSPFWFFIMLCSSVLLLFRVIWE